MATSTRSFLIELYEEYLEEASFLYAQRLTLLENPEITWIKIGEFEERFEAHIDGLVVGGDLALDVCKTHALEGDFGELHAAMRVFCRQNRKDLLFSALDSVDLEDAEKLGALGDALKYELPKNWHPDLLHYADKKRVLLPLAVKTLSYQRAQVKDLGQILQDAPAESLPDVVWACGRVGSANLYRPLRIVLDHKDPALQAAAAVALLRLGDDETKARCMEQQRKHSWPAIPLGLAGSRQAVRGFIESAQAQPLTYEQVIALGLLGDVSAVPLLIECLGSEMAEAAAISLQVITGANFVESAFLPDSFDEDELFEDEKKSGAVPLRPDGKPYGRTVKRLSQKVEDWQEWWSANESSFGPDLRYRYGQLYSPHSLIASLKGELTPHSIRKLVCDELVVRYRLPEPLESDMFVSVQQRSIAQIESWAEKEGSRFREGDYYFAGSLA